MKYAWFSQSWAEKNEIYYVYKNDKRDHIKVTHLSDSRIHGYDISDLEFVGMAKIQNKIATIKNGKNDSN